MSNPINIKPDRYKKIYIDLAKHVAFQLRDMKNRLGQQIFPNIEAYKEKQETFNMLVRTLAERCNMTTNQARIEIYISISN